jgi:hypothetical protein
MFNQHFILQNALCIDHTEVLFNNGIEQIVRAADIHPRWDGSERTGSGREEEGAAGTDRPGD